MPDTLRKTLLDHVRGLVADWFEDDADLLKRLKLTNQTKDTERGWLRRSIAKAPADFADLTATIARLTHSAWARTGSFGADKQEFRDNADVDFPVIRNARVVITLRYRLPTAAEEDKNLADEVVNALFDAGPRLNSTLVRSMGEPVIEERDTRPGEKHHPGKVATITVNIEAQQQGRALLTAINT